MAESTVITPIELGRRASMSDAELSGALQSGDPRAYRIAWVELGPLVRRLLTRFFGPGPDVSDLAQEVFVRIFRRAGEIKNPNALRGFVASICLGVARNEARKQRLRRMVGLTATGELPESVGVLGPDLDARQATRRLYGILEHVSAEDRSLYVSRYLERMDMAELARVHGLSFGTAKRRVARAAERIARLIGHDPMLAEYLGKRAAATELEPSS